MENVFTAFAESTDSAGGLHITLPDTDGKGYIPSEEISRRIVKYPSSLCGRYLHVAATDRVTAENIPVYSARLYEEAEYAKIRSTFEEGVRNTYNASFKCITASGKIALYELAQGVVGGIHVRNFSLNRIPSFYDVKLPETLPVTILGFDEDKLTLSSAAGFLGFRESVEHLGLEPGCTADGYALDWLTGGTGVVVILAPNLYTIVNWSPTNRHVRVRIKRIDFENNRVKADFIEENLNPAFRSFDEFVRPEFDLMTDPDAFVKANKPGKKKAAAVDEEDDNEEAVPEVPSFEIRSTVSPFRILEGETIQFDHDHPHSKLDVGIEHGKLTQKHAELAAAVDYLKYTSFDHLYKYLYLTGRPMNERKLRKQLEILCRYSILRRFKFACPEGTPETSKKYTSFVYTRGINYLDFAGTYHSFHYTIPKDGDRATYAKGRLAVNALLLGLLHLYEDVTVENLYKFDSCEEDGKALYTSYHVSSPELGECWLESCRSDYEDRILSRLQRYNLSGRLRSTDNVLITLEDKDHLERFAEKVRDLKLGYTVRMTYDIKCFERGFVKTILPCTPECTSSVESSGIRRFMKTFREKTGGFLTGLFA